MDAVTDRQGAMGQSCGRGKMKRGIGTKRRRIKSSTSLVAPSRVPTSTQDRLRLSGSSIPSAARYVLAQRTRPSCLLHPHRRHLDVLKTQVRAWLAAQVTGLLSLTAGTSHLSLTAPTSRQLRCPRAFYTAAGGSTDRAGGSIDRAATLRWPHAPLHLTTKACHITN